MRYNHLAGAPGQLPQEATIMIQLLPRKPFAALLLSFTPCLFLDAAPAAAKHPQTPEASAAQASPTPVKDRGQWRKLHRRMSKDEVRNLLGEPDTISVSRFAESWYYQRGDVIFDGKGRLDMWTEF